MADVKTPAEKPVTEASPPSGEAYAPAPASERSSLVSKALLGLLVLGLLVYPWLFTLPFQQHIAILIFTFALMAVGWNVLGGYTGQVSLGNTIFFGIGGYSAAVLLRDLLLSPWAGMAVGVLISILVAVIVGYPCFRLAGHYFAIATIAVAEIVHVIAVNSQYLGAAVGISIPILPEGWINMQFHGTDKRPYYYIILAFLAAAMFAVYRIERSKWGFYFRAIKEDPVGARALGVNVQHYKLLAFVISAALTSVAGSFYAMYILFLDPFSMLYIQISITMCLMAVLGGIGTLWGPVIGAVVLIAISEGARLSTGGTGQAVDLLIYGFLVMAVAVYQPKGLMGLINKLVRRGGKGARP